MGNTARAMSPTLHDENESETRRASPSPSGIKTKKRVGSKEVQNLGITMASSGDMTNTENVKLGEVLRAAENAKDAYEDTQVVVRYPQLSNAIAVLSPEMKSVVEGLVVVTRTGRGRKSRRHSFSPALKAPVKKSKK